MPLGLPESNLWAASLIEVRSVFYHCSAQEQSTEPPAVPPLAEGRLALALTSLRGGAFDPGQRLGVGAFDRGQPEARQT